MDEQPIELSDAIWRRDPNQFPLFGHWKRRTFWQWLFRRPKVWVTGWTDGPDWGPNDD